MKDGFFKDRHIDAVRLRIALPALLSVVLFVGAVYLLFFPLMERNFLAQKKEASQRLTETALNVLASYQAMESQGRMSRAQAMDAARRQIRDMRYGNENKDYFWISDLDGILVMHPYRPELEGGTLPQFKDSKGNLLLQTFAEIGRGPGQGFVEYRWQWKDEPESIGDKLSYVRVFKPWGWIVGTGVYLEDVQAEFVEAKQDMGLVALAILFASLALAAVMIRQAHNAGLERQRIWRQRENLLTALGEQERLYRSLVDNLTSGVVLLNPALEIQAMNNQMLRWFPDLDEMGKPACHTLMGEGHPPCDVCAVEATFKKGTVHEKVGRLKVDGEWRDFRVVANPVKEIDGQVVAVIEMFEDITDRLRSEQALRDAEQRYRSIFENAVEGLFQTTQEGRFLTANPAMARLLGYDSGQELVDSVTDIARDVYVDPDVRTVFRKRVAAEGEVKGFEGLARRKDGRTIWLSANVCALRDGRGDIIQFEGSAVDISERKAAELELSRQRAYFQQLFESSPQAIMLTDRDGLIMDVNPSFTVMFGHAAAAIRGRRGRLVLVPENLYNEAEAFHRSIARGRSIHKETLRRHEDGNMVPVSVVGYPIRLDDEVAGAYYIYQDITERKTFERQLSHQAFHDALTSLPNRSLYMERLAHALERRKRRPGYRFAALMIDLNRFKRINDTHGHHAGDQLLVSIALRLLSCIRTVDTVARLGGDEFAVLLEEFESPREVIQVCDRIGKMLQEPVIVEGNELHTGASIGIVLDTRSYESAEDVLRDADIAMYQAKGRNRPRLVFNKRMHIQAMELGRMESEMRVGLEQGQFVLHYQPIYATRSGLLQGFEALARWNHPRRGLVGPTEFIPLAEETGLIIPLGCWVLGEACAQMAAWQKRGQCPDGISVSVNISARQFAQPDLVEFIQHVLEETGTSPDMLKLEVTESVIMDDAEGATIKLRRLKELGVKLMIDDFGTGYSSLSYLKRFPVDYLKIDRSFISGGSNEGESREIVGTIIALARTLNLQVVAEGVEEPEQYEMLQEMNCDHVQGFMFSRPVNNDRATDILDAFLSAVCPGGTQHGVGGSEDAESAPTNDEEHA
ncbi:MAG: EAL domain-containing protein [Desulfovibrionaceae bacterium]